MSGRIEATTLSYNVRREKGEEKPVGVVFIVPADSSDFRECLRKKREEEEVGNQSKGGERGKRGIFRYHRGDGGGRRKCSVRACRG